MSDKNKKKTIPIEDITSLPLELESQQKASQEKIESVSEGKLILYDQQKKNVDGFQKLLRKKITRQLASSMVACVHCGMCADSCHYSLARPDVFPKWVKASSLADDQDLNHLKNIVFGTCTACRRCTFNCSIGVDTALLIRFARGILTDLGIVPEGVFNVSRDQWETGNQMAVTEEDYLDTLDWMKEELQEELVNPDIDIPIDKEDCDFMYTINPREIKFDPRSIAHAAKLFHFAGEKWTMPKWGWDQTNFGLFSGDDRLGAYVAKNVYLAAIRLRAKRIVISECGHGYRSTRWEGYNWAGYDQNIHTESVILTLMRYIKEGRIHVDPAKNPEPLTFHDSCNLVRSGDLLEEPRWVLKKVCVDFREMYPNKRENFCCTGGGGLLSMAEYKPLRMEVAKVKAEQLKATGAKLVCTICHNCVDGLTDLIKHYKLDMKVVQILELVSRALVI
jgi:Fe-S oxidoreductase